MEIFGYILLVCCSLTTCFCVVYCIVDICSRIFKERKK